MAWAQSAYEFFGLGGYLKKDFDHFSTNITYYMSKLKKSSSHWGKHFHFLLQFDLGYNETQQPTADEIVSFMEQRFDLVLITELFDESLALLKDISCLGISNFTYLKYNQKPARKKVLQEVRNDDSQKSIYEAFPVYTAVYRHFKEKLVEKFNLNNREHEKNLIELRKMNSLMHERCGLNNATTNSTNYIQQKGRLMYNIEEGDSWDCALHKMSQGQSYELLRKTTTRLIEQRQQGAPEHL